jgi:hypothetical protein
MLGNYFRCRSSVQPEAHATPSRPIRSTRIGAVKIDAILVDTFERFGRTDELTSLRHTGMYMVGYVMNFRPDSD